MAKICLVILPSLAESFDIEVTSEEVVSDQKIEEGLSVRELLSRLAARCYRFDRLVFDIRTQKLTGQVLIFLNGRALEPINGLETILHDGDTMTFVPFVEGG